MTRDDLEVPDGGFCQHRRGDGDVAEPLMETTESASDAELLRDYRERRSEQAFASIVERHSPMVTQVGLRVLGGRIADADDVAQAVFMTLAQSPAAVGDPERLAGWLHASATFTARKLIRTRTRRARNEARAAVANAMAATGEPGADDDPELRRRLDDELAELPAILREAVILCHLEGRTQREAAAIAGCPMGTIGWRASEGIKRLRERLERRGLAEASIAALLALWGHAPLAPSAPAARTVASTKLLAGVSALVVAIAAVAALAMPHGPRAVQPAGAALTAAPVAATAPTPAHALTLALSDLAYVGSFRVPHGGATGQDNAVFEYADAGLAFDRARHGLFLKGHAYGQLVAEIGILEPRPIADGDLGALPVATVLQDFAEITGGHLQDEGVGNGVAIRALLLHGGRLIGACTGNLDHADQQRLGFFTASPTLAATEFHGLFRVGAPEVHERSIACCLGEVPPGWEQPLQGTVLAGGVSLGPTIAAIDPVRLGSVAAPAAMLVEYPPDHPTLGAWGDVGPHPVFNSTTTCSGIVFAPGTRTVLVFGTTGMGEVHVGIGTADRALDGHPGDDGVMRVYDPANLSGPCQHAWPYRAYVWAYDADELAQVAAGRKRPWEVVPYAHGPLELPVDSGQNQLDGVAYDAEAGLLYVAQANAEHLDRYSSRPLIHVFRLSAPR
jgi:RNA polymerase sigma factor (sigma-70 family)